MLSKTKQTKTSMIGKENRFKKIKNLLTGPKAVNGNVESQS